MPGASECKRCGYRWTHAGSKPPRCPACKSEHYDQKPETILACTRGGGICDECGTEFLVFGIGKDHFCPNCGSDRWCNKRRYKCVKCGHTWFSLLGRVPRRCSHSEYITDNKTGVRKRIKCTSRNIIEVKEDA